MRLFFLTLTLLTLLAPAAPAQDADQQVKAAADFWLARLRQHYRSEPVRERLTITVDAGRERGREFVLYASQPLDGFREPEVMLDLGEIEVWTRPPGDEEEGPGAVRVAHELDFRSYYEAPATDATTLETMRSHLPPLVVPQLALTLGGPLFPSFPDIEWTHASEDRPVGQTPSVTFKGHSGDAEIRLVIEADDTPRLLEATLETKPGPVSITVTSESLEASGDRLGYDVSRRNRVETLAEIGERSGDLRAGDPLPDMPLIIFSLDGASPTEAYTHRLLLFFDGEKAVKQLPVGPGVAFDALRKAAQEIGPTTRIDPVGVIDTLRGERAIQIVELDMQEAVAPELLLYTYSDRRTIRRFSAEGDSAVVVASKDGTIAGVIDLADVPERVERDGRETVVNALARRVVELCRLIDRRERRPD